jgi:hypothetical protein
VGASDFDQNVVHVAPALHGPGAGERERSLLVPPEVAVALRTARLARSLSPAQEAASCHVPATLILGLEAGRTTEFRDEADLLTTVERIATFLGFPPGTPTADILRAWSSAYGRQLGTEMGLPEPLAPTQPLPLVSHQGSAPARSAPGSPDFSQGGPGPRRSGSRSPPLPAEPSPPSVRRRARSPRALLVALCAGAIAVVGVGATFGVLEAGLFGRDHGHSGPSTSSLPAERSLQASSPLLQKTSTGSGQATYAVAASSYELTVRSDRPSWVRVGTTTGAPQFAGIVTPGTTEHLSLGEPVQVQIGAGGTTITVSSGRASTTLSPPSAPYTYQLNSRPAPAERGKPVH